MQLAAMEVLELVMGLEPGLLRSHILQQASSHASAGVSSLQTGMIIQGQTDGIKTSSNVDMPNNVSLSNGEEGSITPADMVDVQSTNKEACTFNFFALLISLLSGTSHQNSSVLHDSDHQGLQPRVTEVIRMLLDKQSLEVCFLRWSIFMPN